MDAARREPGRVGVAIRAENVLLGTRTAEAEVRLEAHLVEVIYRGTSFGDVLELEGGQRLTATSTRRETDGESGPLAFGFVADDPVLLQD